MKIHEYLVRKLHLSDILFTDYEHDVYDAFVKLFPDEHDVLLDKYIQL